MSQLAQQIIREAKETHATWIDLYNTGITEIPDEVFELDWLEELFLTGYYWVTENEKLTLKESLNRGPYNNIININSRILNLSQLTSLTISGSGKPIEGIDIISHLTNLTYLVIGDVILDKNFSLENLNKLFL